MHSLHHIVLIVLLWLGCGAQTAHAWRLEAGEATTNVTTFKAVVFQNAFDVTPVVVVLPTSEGSEPATLRIKNVTTNGFDVAAVEPTNSPGGHPSMTFHYVAMEAGTHKLPDGTQLAAGKHTTSTMIGKFASPTGWDTVSFGTTLSPGSSVVASIQTMNSESGSPPSAPSSPILSVATLNPGATSVQVSLDRAEDSSGTVIPESIGWIAFPSTDNGSFLDVADNSISWDARSTIDNIVGWGNGCRTYPFSAATWVNARVLASKNTRNGVDGGWLRRCSLSGTQIGLVIDEDQANDDERNHTTEAASLLSFSDSFHAEFAGKIEANKTVSISSGTYALPGSAVTYTIAAQSVGTFPIDTDAMVFKDSLPPELALRVVDIGAPGSGPVNFIEGSPASALSYSYLGLANLTDDVDFSNNSGATFTYIPTADGLGADSNVTDIRVTPKGDFAARSVSGSPSFSIEFNAIIK